MIAKLLRLLQVATWLVAVVLAFVVVSTRSDAAPLPTTAAMTVTTWAGTGSNAEFRAELEQYAIAHRITLAQEVPDFADRGAIRHLYLVDGDPAVPGDRWLRTGLNGFGGSTSTVVHALSEAGIRSPLGAYVVFGDVSKAASLQTFFSDKGMTSELTTMSRIGPIPRSVLLAGAAVMLLTVSVVGAYVVAGTRRYAVARLHGLPQPHLLLHDLRRYASPWLVAGAATLAVTSLGIALRHGTAGIGLFVLTATGIQVLLLLAAVVTHALFLTMITSVDMLRALKGDLPTRSLTITAYGLRLIGVIVATATIATTFTLTADVAGRDRSRTAFDELGHVAAISLGNAYTLKDQALLDATVGPWLRDVDRQGDLLLAAQQTLTEPSGGGVSTLLVNDVFLRQQPVQLASGGLLDGPSTDAITVVVPDSRWDSRESLVPLLGLEAQLRPGAQVTYAFRRAAAAQRYFTYAPAAGPAASVNVWDAAATFVSDPVLVLLPSARGWLSDGSYASFASQGGALATDSQVVSEAVAAQPPLERFVRGATPVADQAAAALAEQTTQLRMSVFTAGIGCLVVVISGVAAALTHTRRLAQRVFVRHILGWPFVVIHRSILAVELVLLAGLVAWIPWQVLQQRRELASWQVAGAPLPVELPTVTAAQLAAIALLALLTSGGFLLALASAHRRVVRWGANAA